ncbi:MAG: nucleotidyl transferase AbiEii/AbiGii toxin family protein [Planctomycetota bacterium]|nr:nucleotidyl transferase AbiEii/AbiGii toxin family protein [Planctomycetota bacterium]
MEFDRALADVAIILDRLAISYAVMGGLAVRVYGIPRATYDVDLTISLERERLPELFDALENAGYSIPKPYRSGWVDEVGNLPLVKFRLYLSKGRGIDVDVFLAECDFLREVISRRRMATLGDQEIWLVSPEDLILLKLVAGRPRDVADVGDVLFTQRELDKHYMQPGQTV